MGSEFMFEAERDLAPRGGAGMGERRRALRECGYACGPHKESRPTDTHEEKRGKTDTHKEKGGNKASYERNTSTPRLWRLGPFVFPSAA